MNLHERVVFNAARDVWDRTRQPVSANAIAEATGFDDETTQQVLLALDLKGYFADALRATTGSIQ
ncbi:hypothetical protein [Mycobacterium colombiense]|uniref:hypothetical protein n=1 Tax=Mycobacterium colombiense TaxID=339268 RepID=UPI0012DB0AF4|nr:hypothetical protein [Mycobacterium colombiense]